MNNKYKKQQLSYSLNFSVELAKRFNKLNYQYRIIGIYAYYRPSIEAYMCNFLIDTQFYSFTQFKSHYIFLTKWLIIERIKENTSYYCLKQKLADIIFPIENIKYNEPQIKNNKIITFLPFYYDIPNNKKALQFLKTHVFISHFDEIYDNFLSKFSIIKNIQSDY